jgi:GTPase SAR1 family protein
MAAAAAAPSAPAGGIPQIAPLAKYKLVFLGDQGAGKTSIITRSRGSRAARAPRAAEA